MGRLEGRGGGRGVRRRELCCFGKRYYDAEVGRWTAVDPDGQYYDGYAYSGNGHNPVSFADDDGGFMNFVIGAGVGVATGVGIAALTSLATGQEFDYSATDFFIDAGTGAVGAGLVGKFAKAGDVWKLYQAANKAKNAAKITQSAHKIMQAEKATAALKEGAQTLVAANVIFTPAKQGIKQVAHTIADNVQESMPESPQTVTSGGATSDKTTTKTILKK